MPTLVYALPFALALAWLVAAEAAEAAPRYAPTEADIARIAAMLPDAPGLPVPPASDRRAWSRAARRSEVQAVVARAEGYLKSPLPAMTEELYLDYSRTGNRDRAQGPMFERRSRVSVYALAECAEGRGRFLGPLQEAIRSISAERSWVLPAHDGNLQTFNGKLITVDLGAAMYAADLATAAALLGDRLSPDIRTLIASDLDRRVFEPVRQMVAGKQPGYWLDYKMNWNSVCLDGVTTAALAAMPDRQGRAWFAAVAKRYSNNALEGFTPDGYCDEGVSYWNYGFGHYVALSEVLRRTTRGGVDLLNRDEAVMPAAYGTRVEIMGGVCPAFADCPVTARPSAGLVDLLSRRFAGKGTLPRRAALGAGLCDQVMALFPDDPPRAVTGAKWPAADTRRAWFPIEGVLVSRPLRGGRMGVAMQGGHNAQNHNHNDVGVFMVVVNGVAVLPDIGAEVYTRRTFSAQRYESAALNSWGHAVPLIGGKMQKTGRAAEAGLLGCRFTDDADELSLDIRPAYELPDPAILQRTFRFERKAERFTVTDRFDFAEPTSYETSLLTFGIWEQTGPAELRVTDSGQSVIIRIQAPEGVRLAFAAAPVEEELTARRKATRIAVRLVGNMKQGSLAMVFTPGTEAKPAAKR